MLKALPRPYGLGHFGHVEDMTLCGFNTFILPTLFPGPYSLRPELTFPCKVPDKSGKSMEKLSHFFDDF